MLSSQQENIILILVISVVLLLLVSFLVSFILIYRKKQKRNKEEKQALQMQFEQELIQTAAEVREATLQNIAVEIHDHIGQLLSITSATLSAIHLPDSTKEANKLQAAKQTLQESIKELRQLAKLLQADSLLEEGLLVAIGAEVTRIKKMDAIDISFTQDIDNTYKPEHKKELFILRVVQETINNCIRHAEASSLILTLQFKANQLSLSITDNGKGFDTEALTKKGMGLLNMQKRASLMNGALSVISAPQQGTQIKLLVPYA